MTWKVATIYQNDQPSLILHSIENQESGSVSCLLLSISENEASSSVKDAHVVHLELVTFSKAKGSSLGIDSYCCEVIQHFKGYSTPVYAAIEPGCTAILVASDKPFTLVKGMFFVFIFCCNSCGVWLVNCNNPDIMIWSTERLENCFCHHWLIPYVRFLVKSIFACLLSLDSIEKDVQCIWKVMLH